MTMTLRALCDWVLSDIPTIITLTIRNIECEVVSTIGYCKVYQLEILLLTQMVFKIDMSC